MIDETGRDGPGARRAPDRLLWRAARRGGAHLWVLGATALVVAAAETLLPAALGRAVDAVAGQAPGLWLVWASGLVATLVAADVLDDLAVGRVTAEATAWLRRSLLHRVLAAGTGRRPLAPGDVAGRMVANASTAGRAGPDVVRGAANLLPPVGAVVALALIDPWLCVAFLAGLPLLVVLLRVFVRDASEMASGYLDAQARIAARLGDALAGARTIAVAGTAGLEARRVLGPLPDLRRYGMGMWRAQVRLATQDALLLPLLEVVVLAVAGFELSAGRLSAGEVLAASQYVQIGATIGSVGQAATRLARARAGAARVADALDRPAPVYGRQPLPPGAGRLELRNVTVRDEEGTVVLDRLSLDVPAGALVALVGRSGSGKSLVAALAGRLVDPDEGAVLLDGVPLDRVARHELRTEVTYGFERPALLGDTVAGAVALGATRPTREEVVDAAVSARADDFVRHLPAGYDTPLADAPMSGGEAQRLGLARTFAHAGRLVVLDDVAASLDTVTEHQIGRVLTRRLRDRTRLVVAHRAATAARADLVAWIDGGRVRALAPHAELWGDPAYRALFVPDESPAAAPPAAVAEGAA